jgi:hypothetical protein
MAFQTPITIKEAIKNIHEKKYLMPTIQREVVWNTGQIERLFDSLMRDDPVGSFLFWMVRKKQTAADAKNSREIVLTCRGRRQLCEQIVGNGPRASRCLPSR